jgi:hypothetical protein
MAGGRTELEDLPRVPSDAHVLRLVHGYANASLSWKFSVSAGTLTIYAQVQGNTGLEPIDGTLPWNAFAWADLFCVFSDT